MAIGTINDKLYNENGELVVTDEDNSKDFIAPVTKLAK